ncbi:MAG: tRNA (adenosine(37)-N6)-dimethylallyltransferase MiaA [Lachnospiraceae bacterium]|nr:tRNA (adenosine(37)-N6)-dimethylallyltransferase MiaA [Lachnospiraceae bacterium]
MDGHSNEKQIARKSPLIVIGGATAVGKTELSIALAKRVGGEIINADSMQVYRHMNIGTAKVEKARMQGITHHLLSVIEPSEEYNVAIFQRMAKQCISEIEERGNIPVLVGGSGFYMKALLYDTHFDERAGGAGEREAILEAIAREQGTDALHEILKEMDEDAAAVIHPHNTKRLIRAISYCEQTGNLISQHNKTEKLRPSPYNFCYFVLNDHRERIYENINLRVEQMMEKGLLQEVEKLREMGLNDEMVSMQGLGYKEILACLGGKCDLDTAVTLIKRDTRRFAKRQLTWYRREREVIWLNRFEYQDDNAVLDEMEKHLYSKRIAVKE